MRYFENSTLTFHIEPQEFDRHSPREILQYTVGGLIWRMQSVMIPLSRQNVV